MSGEEIDIEEAIIGIGGFLADIANPNQKIDKIGRFEQDGIIVDTRWTDDDKHYETGILAPQYYDGYIIVAAYGEDRVAAQAGHTYWVLFITDIPPPEELVNIKQWGMPERHFPLKRGENLSA